MTPSARREMLNNSQNTVMTFSRVRQVAQHVACCVFFMGLVVTASADQFKVATVDMLRLLNEFHERKAVEAEEKAEFEEIQKAGKEQLVAIEALREELQKLQNEFNDPSLSPDKRKSVAAEADGKMKYLGLLENKLQEFLKLRQESLKAKMQGLIDDLRQKVIVAVNEYAATQDVDFVFDESGYTTLNAPFLLYVRHRNDLTDAVLEDLNKDAPPAPDTKKSENDSTK